MLKINNMFNKIKETTAPALFAKGMLKYKQGDFEEAKSLMLKAVKNMPDLKKDNFYKAAFLLVESELGEDFDTAVYEEALDSLKDSPYKETNDFKIIVDALKRQLNHLNRR